MKAIHSVSGSVTSKSQRKLAFHELPGPIPRKFFFYRPPTALPYAPLVVSVHGIARNAAAHAYRLMEEAARYGLCVAAPLFDKSSYGQYQQLEDTKTGARSDAALFAILDAAARMADTDISQILLFGYSGGAQFAHRFAMAYPERVHSAVLAAAGWYTMPQEHVRYPYGLETQSMGSSLSFDVARIAQVRYHVIVGQLDVERDSSLRRSKRLDRHQGSTRVERALRWVDAMSKLASEEQGHAPPSFMMLPGVGHGFAESVEQAGLAERVFDRFAADARLEPLAHN